MFLHACTTVSTPSVMISIPVASMCMPVGIFCTLIDTIYIPVAVGVMYLQAAGMAGRNTAFCWRSPFVPVPGNIHYYLKNSQFHMTLVTLVYFVHG